MLPGSKRMGRVSPAAGKKYRRGADEACGVRGPRHWPDVTIPPRVGAQRVRASWISIEFAWPDHRRLAHINFLAALIKNRRRRTFISKRERFPGERV